MKCTCTRDREDGRSSAPDAAAGDEDVATASCDEAFACGGVFASAFAGESDPFVPLPPLIVGAGSRCLLELHARTTATPVAYSNATDRRVKRQFIPPNMREHTTPATHLPVLNAITYKECGV